MTVDEIQLALDDMRGRNAYTVRLFLDNGTTVLAHAWEDNRLRDGLLTVIARDRRVLVAISRIVAVEMVPRPNW